MTEIQPLPQRIDSEELQKIKNQFALRDRANAEFYENNQLERRSPALIFNEASNNASLSSSTLSGLSYPLKLNGNGGLSLSYGYDRIREQILEILDTRLGERVYRPFFGTPELIFETINEDVLAQTLKKQIQGAIKFQIDLDVVVKITDLGTASIYVIYSDEGATPQMVKYSFRT
jgi:hypothetical protein